MQDHRYLDNEDEISFPSLDYCSNGSPARPLKGVVLPLCY